MTLFWILFFLSIPVFYILGLVYFIRIISGKNKGSKEPTRKEFLLVIVEKLKTEVEKQPGKKVSELLKTYEAELKDLTEGHFTESELAGVTPKRSKEDWSEPAIAASEVRSKSVLNQDLNQVWDNWYSENSINLLLYVGAFLIVAAASLFVGLQWSSIDNTIKAFLLTILTLAFFGFGLWFHSIPKIKNAGTTFISIGSLLIPFCGLAWYNFVLKDLGVSFGAAWLGTSVVSLAVYCLLAYQLRSTIYTYLSTLSTLSLITSAVNVTDLAYEYYVLGGIVTTFVLLLVRINLIKQDAESKKIYSSPLEISENIILPFSLVFGLMLAAGADRLYTWQASLSIFMGAVYYLVAYVNSKKSAYLYTSEALLPLAVILFLNWLKVDRLMILHLMNLFPLLYLGLGYYFAQKKEDEKSDINTVFGILISIAVFVLSFAFEPPPLDQTLWAIYPAVTALAAVVIKNRSEYLIITPFSVAIATYIFYTKLLSIPDKPEHLALIYAAIALIYYAGTVQLQKLKNYLPILVFSTGFFFFIALLFVYSSNLYLLIVTLIIAATAAFSSFQFKETRLLYVSNLFVYVALFNLLNWQNIEGEYAPLAFAALATVLYVSSRLMPAEIGLRYRESALAGISITTILSGLASIDSFQGPLERNALVSAYATTVLFGFESSLRQKESLAYATSGIGLATYWWQMKFLGFDEMQIFTLPTGLYFMVLAYLRGLKKDLEKRSVLDMIGLLFLLGSSFLQAFGGNGAMYALLLGLEGVALIAAGISSQYKTYTYSGVAAIVMAVITQIYDDILNLPEWLTIGGAGLGFLIFAIFLLLRRKENPKN